MNKKIILGLPLMLAATALASCGGGNGGEESSTASTSTDSSATSSAAPADGYSIKVVYPDGTPVKAKEASVQLCTDSNCFRPVDTNDEGIAFAKYEPNNYYVHLEDYPEGYTYNPNLYVLTPTEKSITVQLETLNGKASFHTIAPGEQGPFTGTGLSLYDGRLPVNPGIYDFTFEDERAVGYLAFAPNKPGKYLIESWAVDNAATNNIDPIMGLYGTSASYQFTAPIETYDNHGKSKNFSTVLNLDSSNFIHTDEADEDGNPKLQVDENGNNICGSSYTYAITVQKADRFGMGACHFAVAFTRIGDADERVVVEKEVVPCTETRKAPEAEEDEEFKFCVLDGSDVAVFNSEDGYYHLGSADGALLYACLNQDIPWMNSSLVAAAANQGPTYFVTDNGTKTYEECFQGYLRLCNSDGATPVNEEVKQMLDAIQYARVLFTQSETMQGSLRVEAEKGFEWLFAVGYYTEKAGIKAENPMYLAAMDDTLVINLQPEQCFYLAATSFVPCSWELSCANPNVRFNYKGYSKLGSEGPLVVTSTGDVRDLQTFSIFNESSTKSITAIIQVSYRVEGANTDINNLQVGYNQITFEISADEETPTNVGRFVAPEAGSYNLVCDDVTAYIDIYNDNNQIAFDPKQNPTSESFQLEKDEVIYVGLAFEDVYKYEGTIVFEIVKKDAAPTGSDLVVGDNVISVTDDQFDAELGGRPVIFVAPEDGTYVFSSTSQDLWGGIEFGYAAESLFAGQDVSLTLSKDDVVTVIIGFQDWNQTSGTVSINIAKL